MNRIITWHIPYPGFPLSQFYVERDYTPEKVRILAENAPGGTESKIDIRDDGVSIFVEKGLHPESKSASRLIGTSIQNTTLPKGATVEEDADDLPESPPAIEAGSVLTCHEIDLAGASNVTVQLELESLDDEDEEAE